MDDISTGTLFGLLTILILISAYFSSSETGMMSLNRYRLKHLVKSNHTGAKRVEKLLDRPDRLIGLILIGNNLVNILASSIATIIGMRLFAENEALGLAVSTGLLTIVILIFAEVTPKTLAALHPEKVAFPSSLLLRPMLTLFYPLVWLVNIISNGLLSLLRVNVNHNDNGALSSEELRTVVHEAGAMIPQRHQDMLISILDLEKVTVDDIMVPRNEIIAIDINDDWETLLRQLRNISHTRVLLYRDTIDDAVGFVHTRDALRLLLKEQFDKTTLLRAVKELYFIPEATPLNVQLLKFQRKKERIGLIVDEYGDIQGLVTLEDILEEIVGDFTTTMAPSASEEIEAQPDGSYIIDGTANVRDINKEMNWHFPTNGPKTLNGLILEYLEEIPESNISLKIAGHPLEVLEIENNVIQRVRVQPADKKKPKITF
ncbi:HlyC/CorC family transporter [Moritella viscosa]|uniref:Membrane protein n=2 Tax=Moritella viscosa TaxID=80854 RepID=A0ABY1H914_9GAMM|nr:CNNM domain-containing protein [Moritella viscosa]CED58482.1 putative transport protein [Moritella viscosa]SGY82019.1 Putative membrane protein [Moritella viscosa]SGY82248.1 Putative membrane protein [Moritella viscosa]SGY82558.1 Putative membrane protein [Moritella viscosa]SHN96536.1 Putative membrane protein [Moritella viscosa]